MKLQIKNKRGGSNIHEPFPSYSLWYHCITIVSSKTRKLTLVKSTVFIQTSLPGNTCTFFVYVSISIQFLHSFSEILYLQSRSRIALFTQGSFMLNLITTSTSFYTIPQPISGNH